MRRGREPCGAYCEIGDLMRWADGIWHSKRGTLARGGEAARSLEHSMRRKAGNTGLARKRGNGGGRLLTCRRAPLASGGRGSPSG